MQALTPEQRNEIVRFESGLFTAQIHSKDAGNLVVEGAQGGPQQLSKQDYYFGINDTVAGDYVTRASFKPNVMTLYDAWNRYNPAESNQDDSTDNESGRAAIARGQALFNTKSMQIANVEGLNDDLNMSVIPGTCTTCHNAPNSGNHSVPLAVDIGISDESRRTADMPLYTLKTSLLVKPLKPLIQAAL